MVYATPVVERASPEDECLARMLRGEIEWPAGVDADMFLRRAEFHGVTTLLRHLAEARLARWPAPVVGIVIGAAQRDAAYELARRHEVSRLLALLAKAGAPAILLKGCALAHTLYPAPYCRPVADADILIAPERRTGAFAVLRREGYATTPFQGGELVNAQVSYWTTLASGVRMTFDVHWRIGTSPLFAHVLEYHAARAAAVAVPPLGPHALALCLSDALLHACVHRAPMAAAVPLNAGERRGNRLIWLYDVHLLSGRLDPAGWRRFTAQATRHRLRAICLDALDAAAARLGTVIPGGVRSELQREDKSEPSLALLSGHPWRIKLAELRALPTTRERLRYLRETALPSPEYMLARYGTHKRWLLPALYVRRALGWLVRA